MMVYLLLFLYFIDFTICIDYSLIECAVNNESVFNLCFLDPAGNEIITTYSKNGYYIILKINSTEYNITSKSQTCDGIQFNTELIDVPGQGIGIWHTLSNNGDSTKNVSFAVHADTKIYNNDQVPITIYPNMSGISFEHNGYNLDILFPYVNNHPSVSSIWIGRFNYRKNNLWVNSSINSYSGDDSGFAYSVQNKIIRPNDKFQFSTATTPIKSLDIDKILNVKPDNWLTPSNVFTPSDDFTQSNYFSLSNIFSFSEKFSVSKYFSNSYIFSKSFGFTGSKIFSSSNIFSNTCWFSKSEKFSKSVMFSNSLMFSKSRIFSNSIKFSKSGMFSNSIKFSKSGMFSNSIKFSKSLIFSKSEMFSNSLMFSKSGIFLDSVKFSESLIFSNSEMFSRSGMFSSSDCFTYTKEFTKTKCFSFSFDFSKSKIFPDSFIFSKSKMFSSSENFTKTESFTQTGVFSQSDVFSVSFSFVPTPIQSNFGEVLIESITLSHSYIKVRTVTFSLVKVPSMYTICYSYSKSGFECEIFYYYESFSPYIIYSFQPTYVYSLEFFVETKMKKKLNSTQLIGVVCGSTAALFLILGIVIIIKNKQNPFEGISDIDSSSDFGNQNETMNSSKVEVTVPLDNQEIIDIDMWV